MTIVILLVRVVGGRVGDLPVNGTSVPNDALHMDIQAVPTICSDARNAVTQIEVTLNEVNHEAAYCNQCQRWAMGLQGSSGWVQRTAASANGYS